MHRLPGLWEAADHCGLAFLARVMRIGQLKKARGPVFKNESQRVSL